MDDKTFELIEKMYSEFSQKFDTIDKKFDTIDKRFDTIDKRFDTIDKRFDTIDKRFDTIEAKVDKNSNHIIILENEMKENSKALLDGYKQTYEGVNYPLLKKRGLLGSSGVATSPIPEGLFQAIIFGYATALFRIFLAAFTSRCSEYPQ